MGIGPFGIGIGKVPSARIRPSISSTVAPLNVRGRRVIFFCSLRSGIWPGSTPTIKTSIGVPRGDPLYALALVGEQRLEPVRRALADQDDAGLSDDAVDDVHRSRRGDVGGQPPVAAHAVDDRGGRAGLALDLAERGALRALAEHDERDQHRAHDGEDAEHDRAAEQDAGNLEDARA